MSGHSKWNNIKNRKGAQDAQRASTFALVSKAIRVAVKEGQSADPQANVSLRLALEKARSANMPKDKIQRAIDAGLGRRNGVAAQEFTYEAFGPGGVALVITGLTDNTQRTSAEIRYILSRHQGSLTGPGSAQYLFSRTPSGEYVPQLPPPVLDENTQAQLISLKEALEAHDDVESVYLSVNLPETEAA